MQPLPPNLFARYDPLVKSRALFTWTDSADPTKSISVRPVWIIGDLITINEWLDGPHSRHNWDLKKKKMTVFQHYKQMLLSENAQSLMIEQNKTPVMQIDLMLAKNNDFPGQRDVTDSSLLLHILYKENFRDTGVFSRSLRCIIKYIFSFEEPRFIYIHFTKYDTGLETTLNRIGFKTTHFSNHFGKSQTTFRIDRSAKDLI